MERLSEPGKVGARSQYGGIRISLLSCRLNQVGRAGFPSLSGTHMVVCSNRW